MYTRRFIFKNQTRIEYRIEYFQWTMLTASFSKNSYKIKQITIDYDSIFVELLKYQAFT